MKPRDILEILDLAMIRQQQGDNFIPLFSGDAGLGKSEIAQAWVKKQRERNPNFFFIDARTAYFEPQDMAGLPFTVKDDLGRHRTTYAVPDMWPTNPEAEGLILFEEINRGMLSTMNALMQIFTDRKINGVELSPKTVLACVINPEDAGYDVSKMDSALVNRLMEFKVEYDHKGFLDYMRSKKFTDEVVSFVDGVWNYTPLIECTGDKGIYISPRSISKLNILQDAVNEGQLNNDDVYFEGVRAILGDHWAKSYYAHVNDNRPVLLSDIKKSKKKALEKLAKMSTDKMRTDNVRLTIDSVLDGFKNDKVKDHLLFEVLDAINSEDLVISAIRDIITYRQENIDKFPDMVSSKENNYLVSWLGSESNKPKTKRIRSILLENRTKVVEEKTEV